MREITLALLAAVAAFGQSPSTQPLQKPSISGRVLRQNGDVALRVIVSLVGPERYTMTSDARGAFAFGGVAPGTYWLVAQRAGYSAVKYGGTAPLAVNCPGIDLASWNHAAGGDDAITTFRDCVDRAPGVALNVRPGLELKDLTMRIAQTNVIRGTVTNQDSEGVPGIMTALVRDLGARTLRTVATASIGQDGNFTVDDLPPGRYYLLARASSAQGLVGAMVNGGQVFVAMNQNAPGAAPSESEVATYYPSETDESRAGTVEVKAGDELRGVAILMHRAQTVAVRGTVAMPAGSPQGSMALTLIPKAGPNDGFASNRTVAGPDGSFEFRGVPPGTYVISGRTQTLFGRREVSVGASDLEGARVTMSPAVPLTGTVKMEGAAPAVWPSVTLASDDGSFSGSLKPGPDGKFTAPAALPPGDYAIRLSALPPGAYVKSMSFGSQDALRGKLGLSAANSGALEIVLSMNAAALTGKVTDAAGGAMQGVQVTAWPRNAGGSVHLANTDQNGDFSIADLGPGDYLAAAWEALPAALSDDPAFLGRFQDAAASVRLEEGARAKEDLKLIPREKSDAEAARLP
ncbi:MAG TPA: carboxypeptidase-like regulatory domain-containing protein [Bryobacteraceae bacterium]|nr:carboxypeptidase-like regulatory domain-containing protein [Bryobacteraceae bacterium]